MTENTLKALKIYKASLSKNNLEEGKTYKINYNLKSFTGETFQAKTVKPMIFIDSFEVSPVLLLEFSGQNNNEEGFISFSEPSIILDKYDRDSILTKVENIQESDNYNPSLLKEILKKIGVSNDSKN